MKKLSKIVSVVLSLALCLGMASPVFAASFSDLQNAINGKEGTGTAIKNEDGTDTGRYGYAAQTDESGNVTGYGIEAWNGTRTENVYDENGNVTGTQEVETRNVQLKEDVDFQAGDKGIVIDGKKTGQQNVTINMDGHTIDANPGAILNAVEKEQKEGTPDEYEIVGADGKFYQATTDENGNKVAATDNEGKKIEATDLNEVSILHVKNGANVTVNGENGTLTGGYLPTCNWDSSYGGRRMGPAVFVDNSNVTMNAVNVTGNRGCYHSGGIYVGNFTTDSKSDATFEMNGGSITNNYSKEHGGGLGAMAAKSVILNNVEISDNAAPSVDGSRSGGGVWVRSMSATFDGCTISGNYAGNIGGGIYGGKNSTLNVLNTTITGNKAACWGGGGICIEDYGTLNLQGNNLFSQNEASIAGGGLSMHENTTLNVTGENNVVRNNIAGSWGSDLELKPSVNVCGLYRLNQGVALQDEDGHTISGWFRDSAASRWEEGKVATSAPQDIFTEEKDSDGKDIVVSTDSVWCGLKFAHNKLYDVKVDFNHDGIAEQTVKANAEMENPTDLVIAEPSREGYKFLGWEPSENVKINNDGTIDSKDGNDIKLTAKWEINRYTATFTDPDGGNTFNPSEVEYNNPFTAPADPTREGYTFDGWTLPDGTPFDFSTPATGNIELVAKWTAVNNGGNGDGGGDDGDDVNGGGTTIPDIDVPLAGGPGADTTTIADQEVPLAGLFTRADAIGYLWEQSGSPEAELSDFPDVPEDHRWAVAIGWAQDAGIALPDEDGNFRPDDLVLRASGEPEGELQEFLNRYAAYAGIELDEGELFIVLEGAADDIIMGADAQVIFDGFFAKLEAALQEKAA